MRTTADPFRLSTAWPTPCAEFFTRRAEEILGLSLVAVAGLITTALATWSVDDPEPQQRDRRRGPQPAGLARRDRRRSRHAARRARGDCAARAARFCWGWRLLRAGELGRDPAAPRFVDRRVRRPRPRSRAPCPATARWPLPTGLGGVAGDALLAAAKAVTGRLARPGERVLGFAFAGIAILALYGGLRVRVRRGRAGPDPRQAARRSPIEDEADEAGRDEPGSASSRSARSLTAS